MADDTDADVIAAATAIAIVTGVVLNAIDASSSATFSTSNVRLGH